MRGRRFIILLGSARSNGPGISLSSATVSAGAAIGTTVGTLSVNGGVGTYTFTLTSNPGGLFAISGSDLNVAAALTAGSDAITIQADNGAGSVITQPFLVTVVPVSGPTLDFSNPANVQLFPGAT